MSRNILDYLKDIDRQVQALQRLDRPASAGITATYSGTPAANQVAYWTGAGTVAGASNVTLASGLVVSRPTSESALGYDNVRMGTTATPRFIWENATPAQIWETDVDDTGNWRLFVPGTVRLSVTPAGAASLTGALSVSGTSSFAGTATFGTAIASVIKGGTASGNDLVLESTDHATKGEVVLQPNGGNVYIGTDSPGAAASNLYIERDGNFCALHLVSYRTSASSTRNSFNGYAASGSKASPAPLVAGQPLFRLTGWAYDGTAFQQSAMIEMVPDLNHGAGDVPGRISFQTTPDGSTTPTEAMRIDSSQRVTVGGLTSINATVLGIRAGASTNDAAVGGVVSVITTQVGNVGTGEDQLATYSVPANTLSANGMSVYFEASGTFAANANNKRVAARFGSSGTNLVFDMTSVSINGQDWILRGTIIRTGAATQKAYATLTRATVVPYVNTGLNQTLSGAVSLTIFGEGTSNNDVVIETFKVTWDDTNS